MNAVFECIAKWETAYALSYGSPILRSVILRETGLNLYQYRKQIKELKENGLIKYVRYIERDYCEGCFEGCYFEQGWLPTSKGRQTELYKEIAEAEEKRMEKYWEELGVKKLGENLAIFYLQESKHV